MTDKAADKNTAHQVELAIRKLDSLATLSQVGATFLEKINDYSLSPQQLFELILCDPAMTYKVFALLQDKNINLDPQNLTISNALDHLTLRELRDAFFTMDIYNYADDSEQRLDMRKNMTTYALATACCCQQITQALNPITDTEPAYIAGLLASVGNFALDDAMPRSFKAMVAQAKADRKSLAEIQKNYIATDYTIVGKRFTQKIHLPLQITNAIWLSRSNTAAIADSIDNADLAPIVQLAEFIVRQCGIGDSGSYDLPASPQNVVKKLGIDGEKLQNIRKTLPDNVNKKIQLAGIDAPAHKNNYGKVVHTAAAQMAKDNSAMVAQNQKLAASFSHFDFISDLIANLKNAESPTEIAETIVKKWQKFYQTGTVCLYFLPTPDADFAEAVIADTSADIRTVTIEKPLDQHAVPSSVLNNFDVLGADQCDSWLLNEISADLVFEQLRLVPIIAANQALGAVIFEMRQPTSTEQLVENLKPVSRIIAATLQMSLNWGHQRSLAEKFVELLSEPQPEAAQKIEDQQPEQPETSRQDPYQMLAELAAGAAHELNNPLSVIAGRSQILTQQQTDQTAIESLEEITQNAQQASGIIDDLMSFANPDKPKPQTCSLKSLIEEAEELSKTKTNAQNILLKLDIDENADELFVDSAQIASSIANIITNSTEAYAEQTGEIRISAKRLGEMVTIQIEDDGPGMDEQTAQKATYPFFSKLSAGRRRGMGLAYAQRYTQLNDGKLELQSTPDKGTTVTLSLPAENA